uniref:Small VCP/p97-interacting protein n=1 Tax=Corethrella appendiculata TaxID=1370023 RepID=U5EYK7_9DIPT
MGICSSCFKGSSSDGLLTPDAEIRRQQQREAAEKRRQIEENRGIKDPAKVKRMQERAADLEKRELEAAKHGNQEPTLRWQND